MSEALRETSLELPGQIGEAYNGKVADTFTIDHPAAGELLAVVRTDRISAFDVVLPDAIPHKGQVLNQMSAQLLEDTSDVCPNWLIGTPDPNVSIGYKADPYKIEMIVRGYLLGSAWRAYDQDGTRQICGIEIRDGMQEFEPFGVPIITPTTKAEEGHDENITRDEIIDQGLATEEEYETMAAYSLALFAAGQKAARERGLVLADTKYEFGKLASGQVVAIDEVHTPDSSRFFHEDEFEAYANLDTDKKPSQLSKEFVREWLIEQGFTGEPWQESPRMPEDKIREVSQLYIDLYEKSTGRRFVPTATGEDAQRKMQTNIVNYLETLDS